MSATRHIRASASALAMGPEVVAAVARPMIAAGVSGASGSPDAMRRLTDALAQLKQLSIEPMLQKSVAALRAEDFKTAGDWALKALAEDERCGMAWYCLAIAQEKAGDFKTSIQCYESALALAPDHHEIASNLGRLAHRMGLRDIAEKLFLHYLSHCPGAYEATNNLACCQRDDHRYDEAVETLRPAILAHPENPLLWNTLGTILADQGEFASALPFFDEAMRLDPAFDRARYNRAGSTLQLGHPEEALVDCEAAMTGPMAEHERAMMHLAHATMLLAAGRVAEGWDAYEARLAPHFADSTLFMIDRPRWTPQDEIGGKTLLVMGEQGLGDEVLFANVLPDLMDALGTDGTLILALERRLIPLFQRAYPAATVGPHNTFAVEGRTVRLARFVEDLDGVDLWTPMASLLRRFRPTVGAYPGRPAFLTADPTRVAHWTSVLSQAPPGPKVGILWKSLKLDGSRMRFFSPFDAWQPVLTTPGITFVNLQYGDSAAEVADAKQRLGIEIWTPPGIDLKNDLDDVAALTCALDLVLGPANATSNIAAACGANVWLISTPGAWPKLGTEHYPWYPGMRVFNAPAEDPWGAVMQQIAAALASLPDRTKS